MGKAVALAEKEGVPLSQLSVEQFHSISPDFGDDPCAVFNLDRAFTLRTNPGSPNVQRTAERIAFWRDKLGA